MSFQHTEPNKTQHRAAIPPAPTSLKEALMRTLSATCVAIAQAIKADTLRVVECDGRFGAFWSIEDHHGIIEVALSAEEADRRIGAIREALA